MRRTEEHHHTFEQVLAVLVDAAAVVERAETPDDLRPLAFGKACDLLAAKQIWFEQPGVIPGGLMGIPRAGH